MELETGIKYLGPIYHPVDRKIKKNLESVLIPLVVNNDFGAYAPFI